MKKLIILLVLSLFLCNSCCDSVFADDRYENEPFVGVYSENDKKTAKSQVPSINAVSALVLDTVSGRVLYEKNAYSKRAMASTTKIMTAIIALENGNLNDMVTVSQRAASIWGSTIGLKKGQVLSLKDLMYGLLLNSGNDAAIAIAEHIGGTVENFLDMMNQKALELGAKNTSFRSPHGLDAPEHYTTAYDLAIITRYALNNPTFSKIVGTLTASVQNKSLYNTNELLEIYPGADGVKTGYTGQAGRCLVASATRNNWRIISVVLNSPTRTARAQSSISILNYAYNNYKLHTLLKAEDEIAHLSVVKGVISDVPVKAVDGIVYPMKSDEEEMLETRVELPPSLTAPVLAGVEVGKIEYLLNDKVIAQSALKTAGDVPRKSFFDYLKDILRGLRR